MPWVRRRRSSLVFAAVGASVVVEARMAKTTDFPGNGFEGMEISGDSHPISTRHMLQ